jgi:hypothetical protein
MCLLVIDKLHPTVLSTMIAEISEGDEFLDVERRVERCRLRKS